MDFTAKLCPRTNRLLAAIPEVEWERFAAALSPVDLQLGEVLYEFGTIQPYIYFPTDSVVSLLTEIENGSQAEIAIVGNEGLVGIAPLMGGKTAFSTAVVHSAGSAFRIRAKVMRDEFLLPGPVQQLCLRYTQALLTQVAQTAACNRHHTVDQQLCRWILMSVDRLPSDQLAITQELIANILGVRREGVTQAAGKLQRAGAIQCHRGLIRVVDRSVLEQKACECYEAMKKESTRLIATG